MSAEELHELHEHATHAAHNPSMAPVSLTMAIVAVLVAVVSLLGHRTHTEEILLQTKANDQWGYYQGKDTRLHMDQKLGSLVGFLATTDTTKSAAWLDANKAEVEKYHQQKDDAEAKAREFEHEADLQDKRTDRYDLGEVFLEIALVVTSITLLSGKRAYWYLGMLLAIIGISLACSVALIR